MDELALRLQALQIAGQYSDRLPVALLHAKLIINFVQTGRLLSDDDYLEALLLAARAHAAPYDDPY